MGDDRLKPLRRTITPYVGQTIILAGTTVFLLVVSYKASDWSLMWGAAIIWPCFAMLVLIGLRYQVFWDDSGVVMRASGGPERRIGYEEIAQIKIERSSSSEFLAQSRPFRRIVLYGKTHHRDSYIDISLRHFRPGDIDELLEEIRARRPDLQVPAVPWGRGSL